MIGALSHAIRGAAIDAILSGTERVTKETIAILAEHLDLREVWTRLMDDHDISVSYSSINAHFRSRQGRSA